MPAIALPHYRPPVLHRRWRPTDLRGVRLWLSAQEIAGIAAGGAVATWSDRSGYANDFTQATAAKQPTLQVNILANRPVVRFDGVDDLLVNTSLARSDTSGTIAALVIPRAVPAATVELFGSGDEGAANTAFALGKQSTPNNWRFNQLVAGLGNDNVRGGTTISADVAAVLVGTSSGTGYGLWLNGVAESLTVVAGADTGDWIGDTTGADNLTIGALKVNTETRFWQIDVAEIVYSNVLLDAMERRQLERYLGRQGNVAVS